MVLLPFVALLAAAPAVAPPPARDPNEIIVTGTSLRDTERALAACIARHCPPDQEIEASLAHAENLFVAGRYQNARSVTHHALDRNARFAKQYPSEVSDLYRANGRISIHLGEGSDFVFSTLGIKRALKAGLPETDYRVVGADLEIANMYASMNRVEDARHTFERVEKEAKAINRPDIVGIAEVRLAWLDEIIGDRAAARAALRRLADDKTQANSLARFSALILLARLDRREGKLDSSDALIGELKGAGFPRPVLLFSPPVDIGASRAGLSVDGTQDSGSTTRLMATDNFDDRWVDIGFWVTQGGKVDDPEILRSQGNVGWAKPLLTSIGGRIYSPVTTPGGNYRVERYSYTALQSYVTGSRMRVRGPDPRIEFLDLTAEPTPAK
jgi:tetratricopeptide (TPR) repeat protein